MTTRHLAFAAALALSLPVSTAAQWSPSPTTAVPSASGWPTAGGGRPEGVLNPRVVRGTDAGLLVTGSVLLAVGLGTAATGVILGFTDGDDLWPKAVAPQGIWTAIPGLILIIFAATNFTEDFEPDPTPTGVQVSLGAPGADLGLSVWTTF